MDSKLILVKHIISDEQPVIVIRSRPGSRSMHGIMPVAAIREVEALLPKRLRVTMK